MDPTTNNSLKQSLMSLFANRNQTPVAPPPQPQVGEVEKVDQVEEIDQERILRKTLERIAEVLTTEDMEEFEKIDAEDPSGNAGKYFLETRVPHYLDIMKEEVRFATT